MGNFLQKKGRWQDNVFPICITAVAAVLYVVYVLRSTANVPIMDYWVNYVPRAERILTGEWGWRDFWGNGVNVHHSMLECLLFFIEVKWSHGNVWWRMLLGAFVQIFTIGLLYIEYNRSFVQRSDQKRLAQILWIPLLLAVLVLNQWEIITQQTSLSFFFRTFVYLGFFLWYNDAVINFSAWSVQKKGLLLLAFFIVVNTISQAYFPALFVAMFVTGALQMCLRRKQQDKRATTREIAFLVLFVFTMVLATLLYLSAVQSTPSQEVGGSLFEVIWPRVLDGTFLVAVLTMLGSILLPQSLSSNAPYVWGGIFVGLAICSALWIFFRTRLYKVTWVPFMMILYGLANIPLIVVARINSFDIIGMQSSRYVVETKWILVGILLVWAGALLKVCPEFSLAKISKCLLLAATTLCAVGLVVSDMREWSAGPYRKAYDQNLQNLMLNISWVEDEDLTVFQGGPAKQVREGIEFMRENQQSIFYRLEENSNLSFPGTTKDSMTLKIGLGNDGWVEQGAKLWISTGPEGKVKITGYCTAETPFTENPQLQIRLTNQSDVQTYPVVWDEEGVFVVTLEDLEPNTVVGFQINSNFSRQASPADARIISFILSDIQGL